MKEKPAYETWCEAEGIKVTWGYHIASLDNSTVWTTPDVSHSVTQIFNNREIYEETEIIDWSASVLKELFRGQIPKFESLYTEKEKSIACKITCKLLEMDYNSDIEASFNYPWIQLEKANNLDAKRILDQLENDYISQFFLWQHYGHRPAGWSSFVLQEFSNVSVKRMKDAKIELKADNTGPWTYRPNSLTIRKFDPNLQRLLKIQMAAMKDKSDWPASILQLLMPYRILIEKKEDYEELCDLEVFNEEILTWNDIAEMTMKQKLMDTDVLNSLREISGGINCRNDELESDKAKWLYRFTKWVTISTVISTFATCWTAYQTMRQADAAIKSIPPKSN